MSNSSHRRLFSAAAGTSALALAAAGFALGATPATAAHAPSGADCLQAVSSSGPHSTRASVFTAAAQTYGVPVAVVKGVSYMESRWDAHGSHPSTSGGYGPMHLTDVSAADISRAKGDDSAPHADTSKARHTVQLVAGMTELRQSRLKSDTA
ncbi:MAG: hypothetical protein ACRDP4_08615, partial [Nocardioidaceae bacterium]